MKLARRGSALMVLLLAVMLLGVAVQAFICATQSAGYLAAGVVFIGVSMAALAGSADLWQSAVQTSSDAV